MLHVNFYLKNVLRQQMRALPLSGRAAVGNTQRLQRSNKYQVLARRRPSHLASKADAPKAQEPHRPRSAWHLHPRPAQLNRWAGNKQEAPAYTRRADRLRHTFTLTNLVSMFCPVQPEEIKKSASHSIRNMFARLRNFGLSMKYRHSLS